VKATRNERKYISKEQAEELFNFAKIFGLKPVIFIKFFRSGWYIFTPEQLEKTSKSFIADLKKGVLLK
ncbi:MAG: Holliday junction resolvase, partial [Candidatus Pacearchaeota archaeon]